MTPTDARTMDSKRRKEVETQAVLACSDAKDLIMGGEYDAAIDNLKLAKACPDKLGGRDRGPMEFDL